MSFQGVFLRDRTNDAAAVAVFRRLVTIDVIDQIVEVVGGIAMTISGLWRN